MNFRKKGGGHAIPNEFRCTFLGLPKKVQHCFLGGSEAVWKFSENSSNLLQVIVPYERCFLKNYINFLALPKVRLIHEPINIIIAEWAIIMISINFFNSRPSLL